MGPKDWGAVDADPVRDYFEGRFRGANAILAVKVELQGLEAKILSEHDPGVEVGVSEDVGGRISPSPPSSIPTALCGSI